MDAAEKLMELKHAYADIILNISKEAAVRVMETERRAAQYQHELKLANDEALRMLVRLKEMMDSKITEAQVAALNQQKKIEELEAQLHEAEEIVSDLREELKEVQYELDRDKNEKIQPRNEHDSFGSSELPLDSKFCPFQSSTILPPKPQDEFALASNLTTTYPSQIYGCHNCCILGNQYLPSIIMRGKEPGLYKNGCTQRIHACKDKLKDKTNNTKLSEGKDTCKALSGLQKKLLAGIKTRESFVKKRKRNTRRRKVITRFFGKKSICLPRIDELLELKTDHVKVNVHFCDNPLKDEPNVQLECNESSEKEIDVVEVGNVEDVLMDVELIEEMVPTREETEFVENLESLGCKVDVEVVNIPLSNLNCTESSEKEINLVEVGDVKDVLVDVELIEEMVATREQTKSVENFESLGCKEDVEVVNIPLSNLETISSEITERIQERVIKYTFQRKRKRQSISGSNGNASLGTENRRDDELNGSRELEPSTCSSTAE